MQLYVLASRDVQHAVRIFLSAVGEDLELFRGELTERDLDALHAGGVKLGVRPLRKTAPRKRNVLCAHAIVTSAVVVPLAVYAATKTQLGDDFLFDLAGFSKLDLILECVDLLCDRGGNTRGQCLFPCRHATPSICCAARRSTSRANARTR